MKCLVINIHKGLFRYAKITIWIGGFTSYFQKFINEIIAGKKGAHVYRDDSLVVGFTETKYDLKLGVFILIPII